METREECMRFISDSNALIFGVDIDGKVNLWNKCTANKTGRSSEEILEHGIFEELIPNESRGSFQAMLDRAIGGLEDAPSLVFPLCAKDGQQRMVLLSATPRLCDVGRIIGVIFIGQDITAGIAQGEYHEANDLDTEGKATVWSKGADQDIFTACTYFAYGHEYERLTDKANAPILEIDVEGKVVFWNELLSRLSGYTKAEALGQYLVKKFVVEKDRWPIQNVFDRALQGIEATNFNFALETKAGQSIEIDFSALTRHDASGRIIGVKAVGQVRGVFLAQFINYANIPIFQVDLDCNLTIWNKCASALTRFSPAEVLGRNLVEHFIGEEFQASAEHVLKQALQGEVSSNVEFTFTDKARKEIHFLFNLGPKRDMFGQIIGVFGIGQDITSRVAQEQEYIRLIETANAPIFGVNMAGNIDIWNACAAAITGFSSEWTIGRHLVDDIMIDEFRESIQKVLGRAMGGENTSSFAFSLVSKVGRRLEILMNATSRRNFNGDIVGVVCIGQDITSRVAQEQEYIRLIETANAPILGVDTGGNISIWNQCIRDLTGYQENEVLGRNFVDDFVHPSVKQSIEAILGQIRQGADRTNFDLVFNHKDDAHEVLVVFNASCHNDHEGHLIALVLIGQDTTDTRARYEAEMRQREAEAAAKAQATISAHVYHEIRNVVGSVLALAERASEAVELALESGESIENLPAEVRFLTEHQRLVCGHAVNTLNDMLDVSRMENGTFQPTAVAMDLGELCLHAARLQGPRLKKDVQLRVDCPPQGGLVVVSDPTLLLQFLTNLLSNAAKFTDAGHVTVLCETQAWSSARLAGPENSSGDDGWVEVTLGVADTGPGIPEADQARVLEAFTTGNTLPCEDITGTSVRSTGIGLRLANLIAQIIGSMGPTVVDDGSVEVSMEKSQDSIPDRKRALDMSSGHAHTVLITSPLPEELAATMPAGEGSPGTLLTIKAVMKVASPEERALMADPLATLAPSSILAAAAGGPGAGSTQHSVLEPRGLLRVLVVDDQFTMRQMTAMLFQKFCLDYPNTKIEITTALSGEEACRLVARGHAFHIITMDETMSADYCRTLLNSQEAAADYRGAESPEPKRACQRDPAVPKLLLDTDRLGCSKRRIAFFKDEVSKHEIVDGDGTIAGHVAMRLIVDAYKSAGRSDAPIIVNLTGNVTNQDQELYFENGSSGVLSKPTKVVDLVGLLESQFQTFIAKGTVVLDERGYITTPDRNFAFGCIKPSDPDNVLENFDSSPFPGPPLVSSSSVASASLSVLLNGANVSRIKSKGEEICDRS